MNDSFVVELLVAAVVAGTPLVFAAVGETIGQRSGVMNLGVEGMLMLSAVVAYWGASVGGLFAGLAAGIATGAAVAAVHAVWSITLRASQIVAGLALVIAGTGLANYLGSVGADPLVERFGVDTFEPFLPSALRDLPVVGPVLFGYDPLVYLGWVVAIVAAYVLGRTRVGLELRAVGEAPASADAAGVNVARCRYLAVVVGGALAGLGGAYLSLALFGAWQNNLSAGSGWIAFALVIVAGWRPVRVLFAAYAFGALTSLGFNLQIIEVDVPLDLLTMLPFLVAYIALVAVSRRRFARGLGAPAALAEPYWREQR